MLDLLTDAERLTRLTPPDPSAGPVDMVLDTDTYNEIDDQFAVVHALLSPDRINTQAIYAAPFHNERSDGPGDGMHKSYEEIGRLLDRLDRPMDRFVFKGSTSYLPAADEPVDSPAARDLVERALARLDDAPLYVAAIGAITNVASALLLEPRIVRKIVVVWLGGQPHDWHTAHEFNLKQDLHASRLMFDSGVPLVQFPCANAAEHLRTTLAEVAALIRGTTPIGDYLAEIYQAFFDDHFGKSKVIWDIAATGWLCNPRSAYTIITPAPLLTDQFTWSPDPRRHPIRVAVQVNRDAVFIDLSHKIRGEA